MTVSKAGDTGITTNNKTKRPKQDGIDLRVEDQDKS